jgi:transcriptional regulator with XRE-family HTH domain
LYYSRIEEVDRTRVPSVPSLKQIRESRFLTQEDLAAQSEVSRPTIARLESGSGKVARFATIRKLARVLGVAPEQLVAESENRELKKAA